MIYLFDILTELFNKIKDHTKNKLIQWGKYICYFLLEKSKNISQIVKVLSKFKVNKIS